MERSGGVRSGARRPSATLECRGFRVRFEDYQAGNGPELGDPDAWGPMPPRVGPTPRGGTFRDQCVSAPPLPIDARGSKRISLGPLAALDDATWRPQALQGGDLFVVGAGLVLTMVLVPDFVGDLRRQLDDGDPVALLGSLVVGGPA